MTNRCPVIKSSSQEEMSRIEIACSEAGPGVCGIGKEYETRNSGTYCGLNFVEYMKNKLIRSKADLSVLVYAGNILKKFKTEMYPSEIIAAEHIRFFKDFDICPSREKKSIIRTQAFSDFELRPEPKFPEFSGSESSKPCAKDVFLSRLRTMVSYKFPDFVEDYKGEIKKKKYDDSDITNLKIHPLMSIDQELLQKMKLGTLLHFYSFGDIPGSGFVDYKTIGSRDRSNCENSFGHEFDTGNFTLECRLTPDAVFPLTNGISGDIIAILGIDGKLSTAPFHAFHGQARQMVLYEEGISSQTGIPSKFMLQYAKAMRGRGIRIKKAYKKPELREERLSEVKKLVDEIAVVLPKFVENIRSIESWSPGRIKSEARESIEDEPRCARCKDIKCFTESKCTPENLNSLIDRLDDVGIKQHELDKLRFASKIER